MVAIKKTNSFIPIEKFLFFYFIYLTFLTCFSYSLDITVLIHTYIHTYIHYIYSHIHTYIRYLCPHTAISLPWYTYTSIYYIYIHIDILAPIRIRTISLDFVHPVGSQRGVVANVLDRSEFELQSFLLCSLSHECP